MSVYFVVQEKVHDWDGMAEYSKLAGPSLKGVDFKGLAADNEVETIEGDWHGERVVILQFPTEQDFRDWYNSPAYQEAVKLRLVATDSRGALVKGND